MTNSSNIERKMVTDYRTLLKLIGALALSLPLLMSLGGYLVFKKGIQSSLSSYYYTGMGDVFVGIVFAIGVFLLTYKGFNHREDWLGNFAFGFAMGIALLPTAPDGVNVWPPWSPDGTLVSVKIIGFLHISSAFLFLIALTVFSLFFFPKTDPDKEEGKNTLRKKIFRFCGITILMCVVLMFIEFSVPDLKEWLKPYHPHFWLESIAVCVFGISWCIKGTKIFLDKETKHDEQ